MYLQPTLDISFTCEVSLPIDNSKDAKFDIVYAGSKTLLLSGNIDIELVDNTGAATSTLSQVTIENVDLVTGQLKQTASVGGPYMLKVRAFDNNHQPFETYAEDLAIQVSQESVKKVAISSGSSFYTTAISYECFLSDSGSSCTDQFTGRKSSDFSLVFVPEHIGTISVYSPFFTPSVFHILVTEDTSPEIDPEISNLLSAKNSYAKFEENSASILNVGTQIALLIVPVSYSGN